MHDRDANEHLGVDPLSIFSWDDVDRESDTLNIAGKVRDFRPVLEFPNLVELSIMTATPDRLEIIGQLTSLQSLWIGDFRKVKSLEPLRNLNKLKTLSLVGIINGLSLEHIGALIALEALCLMAGGSTIMNGGRVGVDSFEPIANLINLKHLQIDGVRPGDGTLEPLTRLKNLEKIDILNEFPVREMARLAALLPNTKGMFQEPFFNVELDEELACKKCSRTDFAIMVGTRKARRYRFCRSCQASTIAEYVAEYESLKSEFAKGG